MTDANAVRVTFMTGEDVKRIREALGDFLGRRLSQRDLGLALGLSENNAKRAIRDWETDGPSGPGSVALWLMHGIVTQTRSDHAFRELLQGQVRALFAPREDATHANDQAVTRKT